MSHCVSRIAVGAVVASAALAVISAVPAQAEDSVAGRADYSGRDVMVNMDEFLDGDNSYGDNSFVIKVPISIIVSHYENSPVWGHYGHGPEYSGLLGG
ncbi:hypothetical protein TL08_06065 [Actinoalloteichus hymeniacidonis]|uniref:Uncharacterized protein n=1 Tax=Actinoalloteichus hymeniacidonis TaxID=340345 RepID=A0AAC9MWB8_9PSEU|nr:hypothetical protein TL08_06065 [Actinoalloteichus hymeniacidonis]